MWVGNRTETVCGILAAKLLPFSFPAFYGISLALFATENTLFVRSVRYSIRGIMKPFINLFAAAIAVLCSTALVNASPLFDVLGQDGNIYSIGSDGSYSVLIHSAGGGSLAVDSAGNFYVDTPAFKISKITPSGATSIYSNALNSNAGYIHPGDGLVFDSAGNLYDTSPADGIVAVTAAGGGTPTAVSTTVTYPGAETVDRAGNLYVNSETAGVVYKIANGVTSVFASGFSNQNNGGIALNPQGTLFTTTYGSLGYDAISEISSNGTVNEFISVPGDVFGAIAFDSQGNLYAATQYDNIVQITPSGSVSTFVTLPTDAEAIVNAVPEPTSFFALTALCSFLVSRRRVRRDKSNDSV
jgi:hypothetical protein